MNSYDQKRVSNHLEIKGFMIIDLIKDKFDEKFGEQAKEKLEHASVYYNLYCRSKIDTEVNHLGSELNRQAIELRENNWEYLVNFLKENFEPKDAEYLIKAYKLLAENQEKVYILNHSKNIFKKSKILKDELKNMQNGDEMSL